MQINESITGSYEKFIAAFGLYEVRKLVLDKLNSRLATAANFVRSGTIAADVGTDHGYLICYLIKNGICRRGFATDINEKPLESAKALIKELGYEDIIETVFTDGLTGIPEKAADEILICGMGGETICSILERCPWVKSETVHLVLQPMTKASALRRWLCENGWRIDEEKAVEDEGHLYTVISAYYCGDCETPDNIYCILGELMVSSDDAAIKYMRWQARIQRGIASGLLRSSTGKNVAARYITLADMIDEQADELEAQKQNE